MILHINTSREWRGGENQVLNLAIGLKSRNISQLLFVQTGSPLAERAREHMLDIIEHPMKGEFDYSAIRKIRQTIAERGVRIVHTHTAHAHSLAFFAKRKKDTWKLIAARRVDFRINKNWFSRWKYTSPIVDLVIGVSRCIQKYLIEDGVPAQRTLTIHSGINLRKFAKLPSAEPLRKELNINKKTLVIGNVAALVPHKDHKTLLNAIAKIRTNVDYKVVILGSGQLDASLKDQVKNLGIEDRVLFLGFREEIPAFLNLFDIFTLTSEEEGLGTSILDAMAGGLPVVATRAGGIPEMVVPDQGGYLCDVHDSDALAEKYVLLLENADLRKSMGEWNRRHVESFSYEKMVAKTVQMYYSFLGRNLFKEASSDPLSLPFTDSLPTKPSPKKRSKPRGVKTPSSKISKPK